MSGDSQLSGSSPCSTLLVVIRQATAFTWGESCLQDNSRVWLGILLSALEEELKGLDFMAKFVFFDCFPLFLHFLTCN